MRTPRKFLNNFLLRVKCFLLKDLPASPRFGPAAKRRNQKGVAMILAVSTLALLVWLAQEVSQESLVEYTINAQGMNRLKAYYAARAGVELSLLRIKVYQQVQAKLGKQLGSQAAMIDEIWRFPFAWPLIAPEGLNAVDKDNMKSITKESFMDASYTVTIEDEGSKLDVNDLISKSKALRENTKKQLINMFEQKIKSDDDFQKKYGNTRWEDLVNQITDWMSDKNAASGGGGDKKSAFRDLGSEELPPNRGFRTVQELRMVPMINEDFFNLLEPRITIYGMKGINPNSATKDVLMSLDSGITEEVASAITKRREDQNLGGPFKDAQDFWGFVNSKGARISADPQTIPLIFESLSAFKIRSTGEFGRATREITAIVYDTELTAKRIKGYLDKEKPAPTPGPDGKVPNPTPTPATTASGSSTAGSGASKGAPKIVYWYER